MIKPNFGQRQPRVVTHVILLLLVFRHYCFWLRFFVRMVFLARKEHGGVCDEHGVQRLPLLHHGGHRGLFGLYRISRGWMVSFRSPNPDFKTPEWKFLYLKFFKPLLKLWHFQRFFEQMSSIKTRKHYVIFDMAFSGLWAFFYFITFVYMVVAWSKTEEIKFNFASSNIIGAIFFAFLSIFAWVKNDCKSKWESNAQHFFLTPKVLLAPRAVL